MSKVDTLTDLVNLENQTTAVNAVNSNNTKIEAAFENTLSRDGSGPNQMLANLDMNSNRILNLPEPSTLNEPLRLADVDTLNGDGTIIVNDTVGIRPETYGALGNGIQDDSDAVNQAMEACYAAGGGYVLLSPNKTYRLASYKTSNGALITPYSNVSIIGSGPTSILKVGNGLNTGSFQFLVIYPPDQTSTYTYTNQVYKDFCIDFNGANNTGHNYQNVGIGVSFGSNITIDGVVFKNNPGSQNIHIGKDVDSYDIINTVHIDCAATVNASCTDHSSIQSVGSNYILANNRFISSSQSTKATAFEMWGSNGVAVNNVTSKYAKGVNIAALSTAQTVTRKILVSDNTFTSMQWGITLWNDSGSVLEDVIMSNNYFKQAIHNTAVDFFDFDQLVTAAGAKNIIFQGNSFVSTVAAGAAASNPTLRLGRGINQRILNNNFTNGLGPAIGNGTFTALVTSFDLVGNKIIDAGQTVTAAGQRGVLISAVPQIAYCRISGNTANNVAATYMTTGFDITLPVVTGVIEPNNQSNAATGFATTVSGFSGNTNFRGIVYGGSFGNPLESTSNAASSVLVTNGSSVPSLSTTLPSGIAATNMALTTPAIGTATGARLTLTSNNAAVLTVGPNGATNPVFNVDGSIASSVAGITLKGAVTGGGTPVEFLATDPGADASLRFSSKGAGSVSFKAGSSVILFATATDAAYGIPVFWNSANASGYGTGSGGVVTQITSRTTGVTLNTPSGAITLVSAAGTTSFQDMVVTNSKVAATDTVRVCQKSGTDKYAIHVTAVAAGSFTITYATLSGTTVEQPVFNFSVLKGSIS